MENKEVLLTKLDKIHTTERGIDRIKKNLNLGCEDAVAYCKEKILDKNCKIYQQGKNWYCETGPIKITINASSYTIITAHIMKSFRGEINDKKI